MSGTRQSFLLVFVFYGCFSSGVTEDQLCSLYINAPKFSKKTKLLINFVRCRNLRDAGLVQVSMRLSSILVFIPYLRC